jgi:hypothetical protein
MVCLRKINYDRLINFYKLQMINLFEINCLNFIKYDCYLFFYLKFYFLDKKFLSKKIKIYFLFRSVLDFFRDFDLIAMANRTKFFVLFLDLMVFDSFTFSDFLALVGSHFLLEGFLSRPVEVKSVLIVLHNLMEWVFSSKFDKCSRKHLALILSKFFFIKKFSLLKFLSLEAFQLSLNAAQRIMLEKFFILLNFNMDIGELKIHPSINYFNVNVFKNQKKLKQWNNVNFF